MPTQYTRLKRALTQNPFLILPTGTVILSAITMLSAPFVAIFTGNPDVIPPILEGGVFGMLGTLLMLGGYIIHDYCKRARTVRPIQFPEEDEETPPSPEPSPSAIPLVIVVHPPSVPETAIAIEIPTTPPPPKRNPTNG